MMAASAACSHPHVFAHTLRFSARGFLALTKNAWFVEVPRFHIDLCVTFSIWYTYLFNIDLEILKPTFSHHQSIHGHSKRMTVLGIEPGLISLHHG